LNQNKKLACRVHMCVFYQLRANHPLCLLSYVLVFNVQEYIIYQQSTTKNQRAKNHYWTGHATNTRINKKNYQGSKYIPSKTSN